jgi:hypothetical protein
VILGTFGVPDSDGVVASTELEEPVRDRIAHGSGVVSSRARGHEAERLLPTEL